MCDKKPGVRCYSSYAIPIRKAEAEYENRLNDQLNALDAHGMMIELNREGHATSEDVSDAEETLAETEKNLSAAEFDLHKLRTAQDATKKGIEDLETELKEAEKTEGHLTKREEDSLVHRLASARVRYDAEMLEHDKEYGTVNGRKASLNWRPEDRERLNEQFREEYARAEKTQKAYKNAQFSGDTENEKSLKEKLDKQLAKARATAKAIRHAAHTHDAVKGGHVPDPIPAETYQKLAGEARHRSREMYSRGEEKEAVKSRIDYAYYSQCAELANSGGKYRGSVLVGDDGKVLPYGWVTNSFTGKQGWVGADNKFLEEDANGKPLGVPGSSTVEVREAMVPSQVSRVWTSEKTNIEIVPVSHKLMTHPHHAELI